MKILLVGNGTRENRGCEAIAITTLKLLFSNIDNIDIEYLSLNTEKDDYLSKLFDIKINNIRTDVISKPSICSIIACKLKILSQKYIATKYFGLKPYIEKLKDCDMVLALGGDNYSDDYGVPYYQWAIANASKIYNKPFVIWGASVGPFNSKKSLNLAKDSLKRVDLITAREDETVKYLNTINISTKIIRVCDSAFHLDVQKIELPELNPNFETVGFNISPLFYNYTNISCDDVIDISSKFIQYLSNEFNVVLIPHVFCKSNNDYEFMEKLTIKCPQAKLIDASFNSMELKYVISKCNYFIGARTHATIAAFSTSVPTLSLAYSLKAEGLNQEIFNSYDFMLDSNNFSADNLIKKFDHLRANSLYAKKCLDEYKLKCESMKLVGVNGIKSLAKTI